MKPTMLTKISLWEVLCSASLIGIWPRFIEPNLLSTKTLSLPITTLPKDLDKLHIVQFSDLHLHPKVTDYFLKKLATRINALNPDILVFTGDLLCFSQILQKERLLTFLNALHSRYGHYAILGNHDYAKNVSINSQGDYDLVEPTNKIVSKAIRLIANPKKPSGIMTEQAKNVPMNQDLADLLSQTPFRLLHNETVIVPIKGCPINICGLGEYSLGRTEPKTAFNNYNTEHPGIVLLHNPDAVPLLKAYPGELILSGHTHGGQINLPFLWNRFTMMEHPQYKRGLMKVDNKYLYVTTGTGSVVPFRFFSIPEVVSITLRCSDGR